MRSCNFCFSLPHHCVFLLSRTSYCCILFFFSSPCRWSKRLHHPLLQSGHEISLSDKWTESWRRWWCTFLSKQVTSFCGFNLSLSILKEQKLIACERQSSVNESMDWMLIASHQSIVIEATAAFTLTTGRESFTSQAWQSIEETRAQDKDCYWEM